MQSFSASAKAEICREYPQNTCCALAECFGILLFCNCFQDTQIKIITESQDFGKLLPRLFRKAFGVSFDQLPEEGGTGKLVFQITAPNKIAAIMDAFGFTRGDTLSLHINLPVVEEDCCKAAFLRGAFLAGGSVTSPAKAYHLEFTTTHKSVARECYTLLHETVGFCPKTASRAGAQVLYLKQSDLISDFLTFLGNSSFLTPHAEEVCRTLSQNHELYILTNSVESVHTNRMRQSLLAPYIKGNFVSECIGYEKPNKFYFDYVFSHIPGITKENCLLIGDSLTSDMQGGINAGIPVCWYNPSRQKVPGTLPLDYVISDLLELPPLVGE